MPSLTIKGIPDDLYRALKRRAEAQRRSLNGEVLICLAQAVRSEAVSEEDLLERLAALHRQLRGKLGRLTTPQIQAARGAGRR